MIDKSRMENLARSYVITLGGTFLAALVLMTLIEILKQSIFSSLSLWESHIITIVVVSLMSTAGAYIIFTSRESFYRRYLEEADERRGAEERVLLLAHTLRCITESVSITDMDDTIIFVNDAFTRIYGYSREEILGKPISVLRSPRNDPRRMKNILSATIAGGWNGELLNRRKDGTEFPAYLSTSIVRNDKDEPIALVGVAADITERKRAESAVIESEERYRRLVELSPEAVVVHSDRRFVYVNPAAVEMFRARNSEELIGRDIFDFVHTGYRKIVRDRVDLVTNRGAGVPLIEEQFVRLDGTTIDVEVAAIPFTYKNTPSVQVVIRDISERKRTEAALRESERRYRFLAENANDVIWMMDANGKFTYVSPSVEKLRGYTPEEVMSQPLEEVLTPASLEQVKGFLNEASGRIQVGERGFPPSVVEIEQPCKDGSTVWTEVLVTILFDDANRFDCFLGVSRNITERKRAEQALLESEERFRNLAENTQDVFWMVTADYTKVIYVNPSYERTWGRSLDALMLHPSEWVQAIHEEDRERVSKAVQSQIDTEGDFEADYRIVQPDGSIRWVQDKGFPIRNDHNKVVAFAGVARDITGRKQAEQALVQAQKMESLGILAGGIAHDFNNLLQAMLGQTYLALKKLNPESTARENIEKAQKAAVRAADLTQQMLAYSGRGKFNVRIIDLNTIIRENIHLLEAGIPKNVQLQLHLSDTPVHIEADVTQVQQIIMNLLINAAEAMEGRPGTITVKTYSQFIPRKQAHLWQVPDGTPIDGTYIVLDVTDNGSGMDHETIGKIFDPFFTTKFTGRGLGLAAVIGIVRGHKGGLQVNSERGQGTTFKIALPRVSSNPDEATSAKTFKPTVGINGHILLIDDEESVREVFTDTMSSHRIPALTASGGEEGVDLYTKFRDDIELVLLDLSMPGMGGEDTYKKLREVNPEVKVVLSSGFAEEEATHQFMGMQLTGFIQKPYQWERLLERLDQFIHGEARPE